MRPYERERDACGIGFVADAEGRSSRRIVDAALDALCRVRHRGAVASDRLTGDGAGLLLPLPSWLAGHGREADRTGLAMLFLDPAAPGAGRAAVEAGCAAEGLKVAGFREVPVEPSALGAQARASAPRIEQAILRRPPVDDTALERRALLARRRIEGSARRGGLGVYVASLSFKTVVYKALCAADALSAFYPDLADRRYEAWFSLFHQRYATNTLPTWERAQPFRLLAHNGEINTIRGNAAAMTAREGRLGGGLPAGLMRPAVDEDTSDSGILDQTLELLLRGGRDLAHAAAMLIPPAWANDPDPEVRDFYRWHACLTEPWDGPAAVVMADGDRVVARLDRNGLRPLRVALCDDGLVACSSEAGAVDTEGHGRVARTRLGPGQTLVVDPEAGGLIHDSQVKARLAHQAPYGDWLRRHARIREPGKPLVGPGPDVLARQVAAGYTKEEFTVVIRPMAVDGAEPTSSMGDDTPQPPLAGHGRPVFSFLKQRFAQVTNPPIDHLRERHVMSIAVLLGARSPLLEEPPDAAALWQLPSFVLRPSAIAGLLADGAVSLDGSFEVTEGPAGLNGACRRAVEQACSAVAEGALCLVVSDERAGRKRAPVPSALCAGAVHHGLVRAGMRTQTGIVVVADDVRESHHAACLLANGADAVCPSLAFESIVDLAGRGRLGGDVGPGEAQDRFAGALENGVLKIMSKMGISTVHSYTGAQIIEAIGLGPDVIDTCFPGVASALGGLSFGDLGEDVLGRHQAAWGPGARLANPGLVKFKRGGEFHALNPEFVEALHEVVGVNELDDDRRSPQEREMAAAHALQRAVKGIDGAYSRFSALSDGRPPSEPRDLLDFAPADAPVPLAEVEPAEDIARRFSTGAMSHGALSAEAHETLSIALNMIRGMANTGEGGEAPERFRDERNSGIKQIASGRFGVTPEYLAFAGELQIKMAQGSKPGEGGQLPGKKVTAEIARLRHTVPGVGLISPPPHHDIYSIEDLAQLIFDLKQANDLAAVSVKLVSSEGIGTIAAGVVKGLADVVHISGGDGGTGASPLSSIKNAGMPWETGLAETQAALVANGLRGRVRLRVDGGFKTGRDVVIGALLGADEFSFGTATLIAQGCILVRTCHRDTCPVGIATQDPALRAKFAGTPEMVARYLLLVAQEVRLLLAGLGLGGVDEAVGRNDLLTLKEPVGPRAERLDLTPLLAGGGGAERRFTGALALQKPRSRLGDQMFEDARAALEDGREQELSYAITTADRSVGARLGTYLGYIFGSGKPPGSVHARLRGSAGQSFGAFLGDGVSLTLTGEANDGVCKGMAGGRVAIRPPADDAGDPCLAGNTVLYGATGGQLYIAGRVGERFAVRNSGAVAVVEGAGEHACEYMTAGAVVILGPTGVNLGAGMSGGEAYVLDHAGDIAQRINPQLVAPYAPTVGQLESLRRVIDRHLEATGSPLARRILGNWDVESQSFCRIAPVEAVARLEGLFDGTAIEPAA
ncbi:MAG: glutamate synthase large subunit [Actinomycetota bacterium]|nr:glutamate synthase large subunit [Actinomycetota bacterium]